MRSILRELIACMLVILWVGCGLCGPIDLQLGGRPQGMGGAFVAIVDDANACYWNPAGLVQLKEREATFMRTRPFNIQEIRIDYLAYCQPVGRGHGTGISWIHKGALLEEGEDGTTSQMREDTYALSYGFSIMPSLSLGVNLKRLSIESTVGSGAGFGLDAGMLFTPLNRLSLGLMVRNLSCVIKDESFPPTFRAGLGVNLFGGRVILALDVNSKEGVNEKQRVYQSHLGVECRIGELLRFLMDPDYQLSKEERSWLVDPLVVRMGIDRGNLSAGIGFRYKMIRMDYAYSNERRYALNYTHRYSMSIRF